MAKDNGMVTVDSLAAIIMAGRFFDSHIETLNAVALKETLTAVLDDTSKLYELWRVLNAFVPAVRALGTTEVGLGGKRLR